MLYHVVLLNFFIGSIVCLCISGDFLCKGSCHLWTKIVPCLHFESRCFWWLTLPYCPGENLWIKVVGAAMLASFWSQGGKHSVCLLSPARTMVAVAVDICIVLCRSEDVPFFFKFVKNFYHQRILNFFKGFFCNIIMWFPLLRSINMVHYIN